MKKTTSTIVVLFLVAFQLFSLKSMSQCTWHTQLIDGFEYTTACPYVIPGTVYTSIPQAHSVHSGSTSLYLNFVDCAGGTGTCAGDTVFKRELPVCRNINQRISAYLTTTFPGAQCDMRMLVIDANNNVLVNTASVLASYSPAWTYYPSGSFTSPTSTVFFVMITNVDGGNGNDLSMDDFLLENCWNFHLGNDTTICNTQTVTLNAGSGYASYFWNDSSTNQTLIAFTTSTAASLHYYTVQVTDSNGCVFSDTMRVTFLPCSGINELSSENPVVVYPNPAQNEITLVYPGLSTHETFFILSDIAGQKLKRIKIENNRQTISVQNITSGVYFYSISEENKIINRGKIKLN